MKNFSELTAIKSTLTVHIRFTVTPVGHLPCLVKLGNKTLYEDIIKEVQTFEIDLPLTDTIDLSVQIYRQHPQAIIISGLYIDGYEAGTGYSELIDPVIQRERLIEQSSLKAGGDAEAMQLDEDFLRALEYGMPPSGGVGMGIDRLLMTLTGLNIRETILFPLVKPE